MKLIISILSILVTNVACMEMDMSAADRAPSSNAARTSRKEDSDSKCCFCYSYGQICLADYTHRRSRFRSRAKCADICKETGGQSAQVEPPYPYVKGRSGADSCPAGSVQTSKVETCEAAASDLELTWAGYEISSTTTYPRGCYKDAGDFVHFNTNSKGEGSKDVFPVCMRAFQWSYSPSQKNINCETWKRENAEDLKEDFNYLEQTDLEYC